MLPTAKQIQAQLQAVGLRVTLHERDERPGWKFSEWEMRGVPVRVEIGPKDIEKSAVMVARRDTREKQSLPMDGLVERIKGLLDGIQRGLFDRAVQFREEHTQPASTYAEFKQILEGRPGFVIAPWCGSADCEAQIKADTQATIRNMPLGRRSRQAAACAATTSHTRRRGSLRPTEGRLGAFTFCQMRR